MLDHMLIRYLYSFTALLFHSVFVVCPSKAYESEHLVILLLVSVFLKYSANILQLFLACVLRAFKLLWPEVSAMTFSST